MTQATQGLNGITLVIHSDVEDMFSHITGMSPDDEEFQEQTDEEGNVIKEETSYDDAMEIIGEKALELAVILPLSLYDHGGITMSVGRHSGWDYSNVGYIYATLEEGRKNWTVDENDTVEAWYGPNKGKRVPLRECMKRVLRSEVEVYDQYLTGDVYGFRVLKKVTTTWVDKNDPTKEVSETELEETDSCWGFYGDNWMINGIADHVPDELFTLDQLEGIKEALKKELQES
jgi:hypothetical protein